MSEKTDLWEKMKDNGLVNDADKAEKADGTLRPMRRWTIPEMKAKLAEKSKDEDSDSKTDEEGKTAKDDSGDGETSPLVGNETPESEDDGDVALTPDEEDGEAPPKSLWDQIEEDQDKYIGGTLKFLGSHNDRFMAIPNIEKSTEIIGFENTEIHFFIVGKEFKSGGAKKSMYQKHNTSNFITIMKLGDEYEIHPKPE